MSRIAAEKAVFLSIPEVKRIKELEHFIDTNEDIQKYFTELKNKQKQMTNAKEFNQNRQYQSFRTEYEQIKTKLFDLPFVEEYFELLDIVDQMLLNFSKDVELQINNLIN